MENVKLRSLENGETIVKVRYRNAFGNVIYIVAKAPTPPGYQPITTNADADAFANQMASECGGWKRGRNWE